MPAIAETSRFKFAVITLHSQSHIASAKAASHLWLSRLLLPRKENGAETIVEVKVYKVGCAQADDVAPKAHVKRSQAVCGADLFEHLKHPLALLGLGQLEPGSN